MQHRFFLPGILFLGLVTQMQVAMAAEPATTTTTRPGEIKGAHLVDIPSWFKDSFLDMRDDIKEATANKKRVMVYVHQNGCPYCAKLVTDNFSNKKIVDFMKANIQAVEINMWGDREVTGLDGITSSEKDWAARNKVWFTPTILFYDEKGELALRINGYYPPEKFMHVLHYVARKKERTQSFADYYMQFSQSKKPGKLAHEPFYLKPPHDLAALSKMDRPLAVFFEEGNCDACRQLHENTFKDPDTLEQLARYHVVQLDRFADTPVITPDGKNTTAAKWARELNIAYTPSAVMFVEGKEVIRIEGFLKAFHVQSVLDYASSGAYKTEPSLQRFIEHRAVEISTQGKTVDIWK
jgi:thioredoxin-related protein